MNPRRLYAKFQDTPVWAYLEDTHTFSPGDFAETPKINISPVDQFLSNFNRPTRRRMMRCAPEFELPPSLTIQDMGTGNIFLIGEPRTDQIRGIPYVSSYLLHLVTPVPGGSAGLAEVIRKEPKGPKEDPGWLQPSLVAYTYMDVEVAAVVHETQVEEVYENSVLIFMPRSVVVQRFDLIYIHDRRYRVSTMYADSGLHIAKCFEEDDDRVDVIYRRSAGGQPRKFDADKGEFISLDQDYHVTVRFVKNHNFASWDSESQDYKDLVVDYAHIGFKPAPKDHIVIDDVTYEVKVVDTDPASRQYRMRVV